MRAKTKPLLLARRIRLRRSKNVKDDRQYVLFPFELSTFDPENEELQGIRVKCG